MCHYTEIRANNKLNIGIVKLYLKTYTNMISQKQAKQQKTLKRSSVVTTLILLVCLTTPITASRYLQVTHHVYCAQNDDPLVETTALSARHCSMKCLNNAQCVAYSQRTGSQCLLYAEACSASSLLQAKQGPSEG